MKKTMIYLPDDLHRYLVREAGERGVSMAEVVREAVAEYKTQRHAEKGVVGIEALIGCLDGEGLEFPADSSMSVDEVLDDYYAPGGLFERENGLADTAD
ncbi:MAG: ribbon-helix-helix protein, CopG family [Actinobacteria bacterium]|nr:MAG: ribbon-helix-helix protein, CopG family [Actinomycetota bacterium]